MFSPAIELGALACNSWKVAARPSGSLTASPRNTTPALTVEPEYLFKTSAFAMLSDPNLSSTLQQAVLFREAVHKSMGCDFLATYLYMTTSMGTHGLPSTALERCRWMALGSQGMENTC
jgi:hypothetical protein